MDKAKTYLIDMRDPGGSMQKAVDRHRFIHYGQEPELILMRPELAKIFIEQTTYLGTAKNLTFAGIEVYRTEDHLEPNTIIII